MMNDRNLTLLKSGSYMFSVSVDVAESHNLDVLSNFKKQENAYACIFSSVIKKDSILIGLYHDAYAANKNEYHARGMDIMKLKEVKIVWEITNNETENEDETCDWENFKIYE